MSDKFSITLFSGDNILSSNIHRTCYFYNIAFVPQTQCIRTQHFIVGRVRYVNNKLILEFCIF